MTADSMAHIKQGHLIILTGPRGAGKSTLCGRLITAFRQQKLQLTGLTSPAVFEGPNKTAINAVNVTNLEKQKLAVYDPQPEDPTAEHRPLHWRFDPAVIEWGNQVFRHAVPTTVLVVDEIGPLELNRGQGWSAALPALDSRQYDLAILVMRPELLTESLTRWPWGKIITVSGVDQVSSKLQEILESFSNMFL